jgi:hypothetical protein
MSDQRNSQHGRVNQGRVVVGNNLAAPTSTFQTEIALSPGKIALNGRAETLMKAPLIDEEQSSQGTLDTPTQVVVDDTSGLQNLIDESRIE